MGPGLDNIMFSDINIYRYRSLLSDIDTIAMSKFKIVEDHDTESMDDRKKFQDCNVQKGEKKLDMI